MEAALALVVSVITGRCGPCCSSEPAGRIASALACGDRAQIRSSHARPFDFSAHSNLLKCLDRVMPSHQNDLKAEIVDVHFSIVEEFIR